MKNRGKKLLTLGFALCMMLAITACGSEANTSNGNNTGENVAATEGEKGSVELGYVEWDTEIASTNVVKTVLEDMGYDVEITPLDNAIMWSGVANGEVDGMVAAWLPVTHGEQYEQYKDQVEDLGANLTGAKIGLVVPEYMEANSIEDLTEEANQEITGIEAGAGVVAGAERAIEEYENLADWDLVPSSSGAMVTALGTAVENESDIIVTGWSPHWKFQTYDLKYLEDPKGVFGGEEEIKTMARQGLQEDMPEVYSVLDNFNWSVEDMESVMLEISEGTSPEEAARNWVDNNQEKVSEWTAQ
ncbi:glycine betaine ABC transporter substrate-binding protein [Peptoniphilus sp. KCTC 25270]|uniref:glycine betaine ABC transporter substrate-binding protein n=1 Tax=Peptoniphilus sp. KCTC 25270 TaxID=2897414 RepID=UPI001E58F931|nr:glycine betaine ABC transporter substrate-binding protein [Peptoniphilus sp. KCTC 25270]MCD1147517.1 glycine betaine ABC transporter substrate-binding protein [Peptoniphilus sp. KCTC 25270]